MKTLKSGGQAAIVVPEGVLFQTNAAFASVKQQLLEDFNLHTILSLPAGVFLPYSGVKTNVIIFERKGGTQDVWFYECEPAQKLTKNKPITDAHLKEFVELYQTRATSDHSWTVPAAELEKDYDLSAKNPAKQVDIEHQTPSDILTDIQKTHATTADLIAELETLITPRINMAQELYELPQGWEWKIFRTLAKTTPEVQFKRFLLFGKNT